LPILPHTQKDNPTKMRRHTRMLRRKGMLVRCVSAALPKKHIEQKKIQHAKQLKSHAPHP
jgi:hypothetical protein